MSINAVSGCCCFSSPFRRAQLGPRAFSSAGPEHGGDSSPRGEAPGLTELCQGQQRARDTGHSPRCPLDMSHGAGVLWSSWVQAPDSAGALRCFSIPRGPSTRVQGRGLKCTLHPRAWLQLSSKCVSALRPPSREPSFQLWVEELCSFSISQIPLIFSAGFSFGKLSHHFYPSCKCMRGFRNGNILKTRTILANEVICK